MKINLILTFVIFTINVLNAQQLEVINTAGGFYQTSKGSITFSVGEVMTETFTSKDCCFTQGFCQSNITITAIHNQPKLGYELIAYPNPVKNYVILRIDKQNLNGLKYLLFDLNGRVIDQKSIIANQTQIPFQFLIPSTYLLKVIDEKQELKVFKIIKSN